MSTQHQQNRWADADSVSAESPALVPVQTTFRHMATSPAVAARVDAEAQKLRRHFDRITHCHVVIVAPHKHHQHGRHYSIHIDLGVPRGPLVINHEPSALRTQKHSEPEASHEDIYVAIRDTFDTARRRLEEHARRLRGDVKGGPAPDTIDPSPDI